MSDSLSLLNTLTKSYSDENLISALRSLARNLRPLSKELTLETDESITQSLLIGEIDFASGGLAISSHLVFGDLTERSSRKKQFDLAKNFLKSSSNQNYQAGIFIFHDSSLVPLTHSYDDMTCYPKFFTVSAHFTMKWDATCTVGVKENYHFCYVYDMIQKIHFSIIILID
jgi:hypothetical protein